MKSPTAAWTWEAALKFKVWLGSPAHPCGTTIGLGATLAVISYVVVFRRGHILWLSWIAMLLTGLTWHIVLTEARHLRLKKH
jgi:hypothetical protein